MHEIHPEPLQQVTILEPSPRPKNLFLRRPAEKEIPVVGMDHEGAEDGLLRVAVARERLVVSLAVLHQPLDGVDVRIPGLANEVAQAIEAGMYASRGRLPTLPGNLYKGSFCDRPSEEVAASRSIEVGSSTWKTGSLSEMGRQE
ncbi:hypothetical protein NLJ89_g11787 [Agrocybe chaxingu]|uniref:Uncharacterized protein n=1 Tax=Agrocybe chaxingu TaxID=84603 RepID=A0A9W8MP29_9AGAR|nr:hypothetical protein NLJ89_g11787 [Agrocybe chaxingu]